MNGRNWEWYWNLYLGTNATIADYRVYFAILGEYAGKTRLAYELRRKADQEPLFSGNDFGCSPLHAVDSVYTLCALLNFLTLRPGDTDREYFEGYTPRQMDWVQSMDADAIRMLVYEAEEASAKRVTWARRVTL